MQLRELIEFLGSSGKVAKNADPHLELSAPASLQMAGTANLSFCGHTAKDPISGLSQTRASAVICDASIDLGPAMANAAIVAVIVTRNARLDFMRVVREFFSRMPPSGVHQSAFVHSTAILGKDVYVGPLCSIGEGVIIGDESILHAGVHLYHDVTLGNRVTINSGTVIGADGFGYERNQNGKLEKFPHLGGVLVEDDVEIGANACIDRGTLGNTVIRCGAKIDNLVHISHNVVVGRDAAVIAVAMVGGGTTIGDGAWIAPSAALRDRLTIGAGATVGIGAVVTKDVPDNTTVIGSPAKPASEFKAIQAFIANAARSKPGKHR
jgi:UDP-3-O-[3-hydroxymyristoyl] glucosamine N-acyltransferase